MPQLDSDQAAIWSRRPWRILAIRTSFFVAIVDDVVLDRERPDAFAELGPDATHARLFGQKFESLEDGVEKPIGHRDARVLSDVRPDLFEVLPCKSGQPIPHL